MRVLILVVFAGGCLDDWETWSDPDGTGVAITPEEGEHDACVDLGIRNDTGETIQCGFAEDDLCPSLGEGLIVLDDREVWTKDEVCCASLDASCILLDETPDAVPVRSWSWAIGD